jgi:hypothetical protein
MDKVYDCFLCDKDGSLKEAVRLSDGHSFVRYRAGKIRNCAPEACSKGSLREHMLTEFPYYIWPMNKVLMIKDVNAVSQKLLELHGSLPYPL